MIFAGFQRKMNVCLMLNNTLEAKANSVDIYEAAAPSRSTLFASSLRALTSTSTSTSTNDVLGSSGAYSHSSYLQARDKGCEVLCI